MKNFKFTKLIKNEKGFTLVEVLVTLTILSIIMGVMSATVSIIMRISTQSNEWNTNLHQVQNAGYWISKDGLMAQAVKTDDPDAFLCLSWVDWSGNSYDINYVIEDNTLIRQLNSSSSTMIAQYIVPEDTTCEWVSEENKLKVTIRASLYGDDSEARYAERTYEVSPRSVAGEDAE